MNVNDFVRSRMRENRTYGSVRGWRRKAPVYSIKVKKEKQNTVTKAVALDRKI